MTDGADILVQILAETDAIFIPVRDYGGPWPQNVYFAVRDYPDRGVPWASGAAGAAGRKESERQLAAMQRAGDVVVYRPYGRTTGVRLSDAADWRARALAGLSSPAATWSAVEELARHSKRGGENYEDVYVPETTMAGHPWGTGDSFMFVVVEDMLLPAVARYWVVWGSDTDGRTYWRLTDLAWELLDAGYSPPPDPADKATPELERLYLDRVKMAVGRLKTATPESTREIGFMPIPAAHHGLPLSHRHPDRRPRRRKKKSA